MTVSRVINGENNVRAVTKEKILKSIRALNYVPNISARALAGKRSFNIGLLYTPPNGFYMSELLLGILEGLGTRGHQLRVHNTRKNPSKADLVSMGAFLDQRIDGVVIPPPLSDDRKIRGLLLKKDIPFVYLSGLRTKGRSRKVCIDDYNSARAITEHLIGLGHTTIAHISGALEQNSSQERLRGYKKALSDADLDISDELVIEGDFTYKSGFLAMKHALTLNKRPTAIFAANDDMAAAAISALYSAGLSVPRDMSVAGFDDSPLASAIAPRLTTVKQPIDRMAHEALIALLDMLKKDSASGQDNEPIMMDYEIIVGGTTSSPKASWHLA